jgi:hypothetical protein
MSFVPTRVPATSWLLAAAVTAGCSAVQPSVTHPPAGQTNSAEACARAEPEEHNCMACASKPGCGYCAQPLAGASDCQPGTREQSTPASCAVALTISSDECEAPPPLASH